MTDSQLKEATKLDQEYTTFRDLFVIPTFGSLGIQNEDFKPDDESTYMCGNSLGLMPRGTRDAINKELDAWGERGVNAHFDHPGRDSGLTPWVDIDLPLIPLLAPIVGAKENEVAVMGSLTSNLNAMLISFYKPEGKKTKILFEKKAFPSDYYAFLNIVKLHGYDEEHLLQVEIDSDKTHLTTNNITEAMDKHKDEIALVCFSGIQYYTGQYFEIAEITAHAKQLGLTVGWDLAHAVGNVPLNLHDWDVDFATWCSYKYLNSGPGAISAIFVHEKHTKDNSTERFSPRLAGWWGNNSETRFKMYEKFDPIKSALSYRQSNPSVIDVVSLKASLELFKKAGGMEKLREKSLLLTSFLQSILVLSKYYIEQDDVLRTKFGYRILTPLNENERGSQLTIFFQPHFDNAEQNIMEKVNKHLYSMGVICDERRPDVIRIAPTALYNTFQEVYKTATGLIDAMSIIALQIEKN